MYEGTTPLVYRLRRIPLHFQSSPNDGYYLQTIRVCFCTLFDMKRLPINNILILNTTWETYQVLHFSPLFLFLSLPHPHTHTNTNSTLSFSPTVSLVSNFLLLTGYLTILRTCSEDYEVPSWVWNIFIEVFIENVGACLYYIHSSLKPGPGPGLELKLY